MSEGRFNPGWFGHPDVIARPSNEILSRIPADKLACTSRNVVVKEGEFMVLRETLYCGTLLIEKDAILYLNRHSVIAVYSIDGCGTISFDDPPDWLEQKR